MKKIIRIILCLVAFVGACSASHTAYGMKKKSTAAKSSDTLQKISHAINKYGGELFQHGAKRLKHFAKQNPDVAFFGGAALALVGGYIALRGVTSKIGQITIGFAFLGIGLYAAFKGMEACSGAKG